MALVPFRVSGAAASQQLSEHLLQIGPYNLLLHQRPRDSGSTAHLQCTASDQQDCQQPPGAAEAEGRQQRHHQQPDLSHVGLVLWQSGYVLADFLLLRLPQLQPGHGSGSISSSCWAGVRVLELGCGAGTVGMFLALAGAQVVITDQRHILPLTLENLALNFPPSNKQGGVVPPDQPTGLGDTEQKQQAAADQQGRLQQHQQSLHTALHTTEPVAPSLSVDAALAAAFCGSTTAAQAAATARDSSEQQLQKAFSSGPLVVEYTWGEAGRLLQQRVAEAAGARLNSAGCCDDVPLTYNSAGTSEQPASSNSSHTLQQQPQQQHSGISMTGFSQPACYDVVVGADLLYDSSSHAALLDSLQVLCAAHTQVFLCYRHRGLGEQALQLSAAASGWAVENVPPHLLHPEFQGGEYRLLRMSKTG